MKESKRDSLNCILFLLETNWLDAEPGTKVFFNDVLVGKVPNQEEGNAEEEPSEEG